MRKAKVPSHDSTLGSFERTDQGPLAAAWIDRVTSLPVVQAAACLYTGRGLRIASQAAGALKSDLYVVSAGLGLVPARRSVPTYGLTISGRGPDSAESKVTGPFDPGDWWRAVSNGPYSVDLASVFDDGGRSPVLIALSQPYARLLATALDALGDGKVERLRIFGAGLDRHLPRRVAHHIMPYDDRLDSIHRGTRLDFPQRGLLHFASHGLTEHPDADVATHAGWVRTILSHRPASARPVRRRASDAEVMVLIAETAAVGQGMGDLLRTLRRDGVACEQARFSRLFRRVQGVKA